MFYSTISLHISFRHFDNFRKKRWQNAVDLFLLLFLIFAFMPKVKALKERNLIVIIDSN